MKLPVCVDPRYHDAVIFDLDGVVTDTAAIHLAAWTEMLGIFLAQRPPAEGEDHAPFTDDDYRHFIDGRPRCDGVAEFLQSRGISLPWGTQTDDGDTIYGLANREQRAFVDRLSKGVPVFNSTVELVRKLEAADVGTAVFSSSRNCDETLQAAGIADLFPVRVDGVVARELGLLSKRDPAVLLEAAKRLEVRPDRCVVVDDAEAGVKAENDGGLR